MSGRRCRAVRRAFEAEHGRPPGRAAVAMEKREAPIKHKPGSVLRWLQSVTVEVSEWRRAKRAYQARRRDGARAA